MYQRKWICNTLKMANMEFHWNGCHGNQAFWQDVKFLCISLRRDYKGYMYAKHRHCIGTTEFILLIHSISNMAKNFEVSGHICCYRNQTFHPIKIMSCRKIAQIMCIKTYISGITYYVHRLYQRKWNTLQMAKYGIFTEMVAMETMSFGKMPSFYALAGGGL